MEDASEGRRQRERENIDGGRESRDHLLQNLQTARRGEKGRREREAGDERATRAGYNVSRRNNSLALAHSLASERRRVTRKVKERELKRGSDSSVSLVTIDSLIVLSSSHSDTGTQAGKQAGRDGSDGRRVESSREDRSDSIHETREE